MSDLLRTIAFAYQRKGARTMPRMELHMLLSMDLRWFAPEESKKVVARAIEWGLLTPEGDVLKIAFDATAVSVPLNFRPQARALLEEEAPSELPRANPAPPPMPTPAPVHESRHDAELERARRGDLISLDVARLIVARRRGEDVRAELADAEALILKI